MVELRDLVPVVERLPRHVGDGVRDDAVILDAVVRDRVHVLELDAPRRDSGGERVLRAVDAAVVGHVHRRVGDAVVGGVERDRVLVGVHIAVEVDQVLVGEVLLEIVHVPVARGLEVDAPVVGAEQVHAADPDDVRIRRVDRDDVVVPPLVERRDRVERAAHVRAERVAQQQRVQLRPGHLPDRAAP